jgi:glycosyltransferase involved in cell wall biosynthesis
MKARICFVSPRNYAVLSREPSIRHVGGAEVQQALLARGLAERGHSVSFVAFDHGQGDGVELDGVRIHTCYRPEAGMRLLRFFHPRLTGLWSALDRTGADVYYVRGASQDAGLVGAWCRLRRRPLLFALAHDLDCDPRLPLLGPLERALYRLGLRCATAIISQTEQQRRRLLAAFGYPSTVIRSACPLPASPAPSDPGGSVLWVARFSPEKRPEWLMELAGALPDLAFTVVGQTNSGSAYGHEMMERLAALPNVDVQGYVAHGDMSSRYARARVLLCTSEAEGFPNVFLEAWARGLPVVSSVDPDGVIAQNGIGRTAGSIGELATALRELLADADGRRECGRRARQYVERNHDLPRCVDALERLVQDVLAA